MIAMRSIHLAILGRCSPILTPGALVAISLNGPPLAWPGFKSKVSIWLGPPFIHNRITERLRCGSGAAASARRSNHPDTQPARAPVAATFSQSRREISGADILGLLEFTAEAQRTQRKSAERRLMQQGSLCYLLPSSSVSP